MSVTIEQIGKLLSEEHLKWTQISDDTVRLGFNVSNYTNRNGEHSLVVLVQLRDGGQYVTANAPDAFRLSGEHKHATMELLLRMQWAWKLIRFEYDHCDGEIRPSAELPLGSMELDARSLSVFVRTLVHVIELTAPAFQHTMSTGEIVMPGTSANRTEPSGLEALSDEHIAVLADLTPAQLQRLVAVLVGIDAPSDEPF